MPYNPIDDGDDSDICPVCDGECTCTKPSLPASTPGAPLSMAELSLRYANASPKPKPKLAPPPPQPIVQKPSLKIKLTLPQSLLAKRRPGSSGSPTPAPGPSNHAHTPTTHRPSSTSSQPKKRGRPPKPLSHQSSVSPPTVTRPFKPIPHKQPASKVLKRPPPPPTTTTSASNKVRQNLKARAGKKAAAAKRRQVISSDEDESSASDFFNDIDMMEHARPAKRPAYATKSNIVPMPHPDDDADFPTFVSASALSSMDSDNSDSLSSLSSFDDSDDSIGKEEESFIIADVQGRQRKEEGQGAVPPKKRVENNPDWVIRARKKSEGPSDIEMDVDSDATEDEDEEKELIEEEDGDATEEDVTMGAMDPIVAQSLGIAMDDDDSTTTDDHRYVGHATGWSDEDDEESSFDADLFFAHLSDDDSNTSSSSSPSSPAHRHLRLNTPFSAAATPMSLSLGEEGDQSDISGALSDGTEGPVRRRSSSHTQNSITSHAAFSRPSRQQQQPELESMPFELTESWDGEVMFTNGKDDGRNMVDLEFEADAAASRFGASGFVVDERGACHAYPYQNLNLGMEGYDLYGTSDVFGSLGAPFHGAEANMFFGGASDDDDDETNDRDADGEPMSDTGYQEEDDGGGEGDTTDEELVGEDDLPNERAMRLFSLPQSVNAINPLSTVSSPANSPGGHAIYGGERGHGGGGYGYGGYGRGRTGRKASRLGNGSLVRPADILEGRVAAFWDSDEMEHDRDDLGMLTARQERVWGRKDTGVEKKRKRGVKEKERAAGPVEVKGTGMGMGKEMSLYAKEHGRKDNREKKGSWRRKERDGRRALEYEGIKEEEEEEADAMPKALGEPFSHRSSEDQSMSMSFSSAEEEDSEDGSGTGSGSPGTSPQQPPPTFFRGPRKGVFATPSAGETRLAVIAEDKKGGAVPSPHPRFNGRRKRKGVSAVDHLLRKHILQSLTAANVNTASGLALNNSISIPAPAMDVATTPSPLDTPMCLANNGNGNTERSPFEQLLQIAAGHSAPASPGSGVEGATAPMMLMQLCERAQEAEPIELDDVLDASFLDGPASNGIDNSASASTPSATSDATTAHAAPSTSTSPDAQTAHPTGGAGAGPADDAKDLSRWDHVSVGAFRQTHERGWDAGASLVADNAMRPAPLAAMMWQQHNPAAMGVGMGMLRPASAAGMIKSDKLAKRRRLMMSSSTMSSPLVLSSASAAAFNGGGGGFGAAPGSAKGPPAPGFQEQQQHQQQQQQQKSRKELRRERKLMKRVASGGSVGGLSAHRHHPHHQFHSHHHHPNSKSRGAGSAQRSHGSFITAVPPLNL